METLTRPAAPGVMTPTQEPETTPVKPPRFSVNDPEAAAMAHRLITWITIGGLGLGTYGTFHAVTTLTFGTSPADRPFNSATFASVHKLAVILVLASQVLQLVGSAALWRRRLMGRTLLLTYACIYLSGLVLVQVMRAIDAASLPEPSLTSQKAMLAMSKLHLVVYGSVFPMFLLVILTRPWVTRLLRRKGEPIPPVAPEGAIWMPADCRGGDCAGKPAETERRAA